METTTVERIARRAIAPRSTDPPWRWAEHNIVVDKTSPFPGKFDANIARCATLCEPNRSQTGEICHGLQGNSVACHTDRLKGCGREQQPVRRGLCRLVQPNAIGSSGGDDNMVRLSHGVVDEDAELAS